METPLFRGTLTPHHRFVSPPLPLNPPLVSQASLAVLGVEAGSPAAILPGLSRLQAEGGAPCWQCRTQTLQQGLLLLLSRCCKNTPLQEFQFLPFPCSRKAQAGLLLLSLGFC